MTNIIIRAILNRNIILDQAMRVKFLQDGQYCYQMMINS